MTNQKETVAKINEIIDRIKKVIAVLTEEITVLRECRVRLVADTVTGKIDDPGCIEIPEYEFVEENVDRENDESIEGMAGGTHEE